MLVLGMLGVLGMGHCNFSVTPHDSRPGPRNDLRAGAHASSRLNYRPTPAPAHTPTLQRLCRALHLCPRLGQLSGHLGPQRLQLGTLAVQLQGKEWEGCNAMELGVRTGWDLTSSPPFLSSRPRSQPLPSSSPPPPLQGLKQWPRAAPLPPTPRIAMRLKLNAPPPAAPPAPPPPSCPRPGPAPPPGPPSAGPAPL